MSSGRMCAMDLFRPAAWAATPLFPANLFDMGDPWLCRSADGKAFRRGLSDERVNALLSRMTLDEKLSYIGGIHAMSIRPIPRLGLPEIRMSDGPIGVRQDRPSTRYPGGIALAATWNPALAAREGTSMGRDCRARGIHILLAPGLNINRVPVCGRNFEYLSGEDPYLASQMVVPFVRGVQSQGVVATVKHFAANNQEFNRMEISAVVPERALREIYLPAFEAAVKEGKAGAVMDAYNQVNGSFCTENRFLNLQVLKTEWGFSGVLMSDWGATHNALAAATGGLDLEMPSGTYFNPEALSALVNKYQLSEGQIDDKVRRILQLIVRNGFLDRPQLDSAIPENDPTSAATALAVAQEGVVLLKNEGKLLPLDRKTVRRVAVLGPDAGPGVPTGWGSSFVHPFNSISLLDGLHELLGSEVKIDYLDTGVGSFASAQFFHPGDDGNLEPGLRAEFFDNPTLSGRPILTRVDSHIDFDWPTGRPLPQLSSDRFSVRWVGMIRASDSGPHAFRARSDDGIRVFLNGELIIDDWQDHAPRTVTAIRPLEAGKTYAVRIDYQNHGGGSALAQVAWASFAVPDAIRDYDVAIVGAGFDGGTEGEETDRTFALPNLQDTLIRNVAKKNPRTAVILFCGGNIDMSPWLDKVPVLLHAWYPGQEGGRALATLLFGEGNPSGKLPVTFEKAFADNPAAANYPSRDGGKTVNYAEGIFVGYRGYDRSGIEPRFPFGFGLSYSNFEYSDMQISLSTAEVGQPIQVKCQIKNVGDRAGAEIAQLYVHPVEPRVERPLRELKGFSKVWLNPGEKKEVTFVLDPNAFQYFDSPTHRFKTDGGRYQLEVGASSRDIRLTQPFELKQERPRSDAAH
ncbi:MAG TPA: glycoside hydrolase family 3 C-terminal domain-containing protein [Chthoniobacterales bacterium]|nr:glycoside hydrolase family 3 C-terminal domain-containing protein [Chthoniobacterales bacterium]